MPDQPQIPPPPQSPPPKTQPTSESPPPTPSESQPAAQKKLKTSHIFIGIIILLFLATTTLLAYQNYQLHQQLSQTQTKPSPSPSPTLDPTTNWQTYTNTQASFSFKYPPLSQLSTDFDDRVFITIGKPVPISGACDEFRFFVIFRGNDLQDKSNQSTYPITVAGKPAQRKDIASNLEGYSCIHSTIFVPTSENPQQNDFMVGVSRQSDKHDELFDQILSTFKFLDSSESAVRNGCVIAGCNSELCIEKSLVDKIGISICLYKPEYSCYKTATCERQADDTCGWTQNPEFRACLNQSK